MSENIKTTPAFTGIVVDDGSVRVPINNHLGIEIGVFYFRPTDIGMIDRYNQVASDFDKIIEPLENVNVNPDGSADDDAEMAALREARERLNKACDFLFDGNMSDAFFGRMHPFSLVGGHFYCELALDAVSNYISKQFDVELKKINKRVAKYTHGYSARTGKHKDGKK